MTDYENDARHDLECLKQAHDAAHMAICTAASFFMAKIDAPISKDEVIEHLILIKEALNSTEDEMRL